MKLSILIATIEGREQVFSELCAYINKQIEQAGLLGEVEIVSIKDNKEMNRGFKRQRMLELAKGDFVSHVDDDDWLKDNYVSIIYEALKSNPDCVGFNVLCDFPNGKFKAVVSTKYKSWESNQDGYDYVRSPNHLAVIKREHALKIGFKDIDFAEDHDFSIRLVDSGLLQKEIFIDEYLYTYRFDPNKKC